MPPFLLPKLKRLMPGPQGILDSLEFERLRTPPGVAPILAAPGSKLFCESQAPALRGMAGDAMFMASHSTPALLHSVCH